MTGDAQRGGDKIFLNLPKCRKIPACLGDQPIGGALRYRRPRSSRRGDDMEARASGDILLFEGFRLDRRGLFRRDERGVFVPVVIGSRALDVLSVLIKSDGDLVSKDEVMAAVWPGTVVEDNNLTVQISALRRILDGRRAEGSSIQTVAGRGYRFVAPVTRREADGGPVTAVVSA